MRSAAVLLVLAGMGLVAGSALAQVPPVPTITVPAPPPVPALPAPLPTIPKLPAPVVPAPQPSASTASAPAVSTQVNQVNLPGVGGATGSQSPQSAQSSSSESSASAGSSSDRRPRVKHLRSSRPWIGTSGKRARRVTTLTFVLPTATRVFFTVTQVSPACDVVGRFSVHGKAGLNRIHFAGRVGRQRLGPGTYRISARTAGGSVVQRVLVVVVDGSAPTRSELAAARAANACSATRSTASATSGATGVTGASNTGALTPEQVDRAFAPQGRPSVSPPTPVPDAPLGGVLATSVEEAAAAIRPILIALLAASILLLGLASLPRVAVADARFNDLLARHRLEIAGVGTVTLLAFAITFLIA